MEKVESTENFLEDSYLRHYVILLLDLFFSPLCRPHDLGESLCDGLIIVLDVVLHGYLKLLIGPLQFLFLFLTVPLFAGLNQL